MAGTQSDEPLSNEDAKRPVREHKRAREEATDEEEDDEEEKGDVARQLSQTQNRRDAMRRVAESRAAHFARADANDRVRIRPVSSGGRSARSTTPLPVAHSKASSSSSSGPAGSSRRA